MPPLSPDLLKFINVAGVIVAAIGAAVAALAGLVASYAGFESNKLSDITIARAAADAKAADSRAAEANALASQAQQKAAEARASAAANEVVALRLKMELARLRSSIAGREIAASQVEIIMKHVQGRYALLGVAHQADPESRMYAMAWVSVLLRAGVKVQSREVSAGFASQDTSSRVWLVTPTRLGDELEREPLYLALHETDLLAGVISNLDRNEPLFDVPYIEIPARSAPAASALEPG